MQTLLTETGYFMYDVNRLVMILLCKCIENHEWNCQEFMQAYIYIYISSSSCRATSTDIPDPLSPRLPIIHRLWQVFRVTSRIIT